MLTKKIFFICLIFLLSLPVFIAYPVEASDDETTILTIATMAPKNIGWAKNIRELIMPQVETISEGKISLKWFWGGIKGDDIQTIELMREGVIDGVALSGQGAVYACPEFSILELPFMFNNYDEVDYVRTNMTGLFEQIAEKNGYKLLLWMDQDFDQVYSIRYMLRDASEYNQTKMICAYGYLENKLITNLGAKPVVISVTDMGASLTKNEADTVIAPALWIVGSQLYTMIRYVSPIKIRYSPAMVLFTNKSWNLLSQNVKSKFLNIQNADHSVFRNKCRNDGKKAYDAMLSFGIQESTPEPEKLAEIQTKCQTLWYDMVGTLYSKELLETLINTLQDYRSGNKK